MAAPTSPDPGTPDPATIEQLRALAVDYAIAVDDRDADAIGALFADDAVLTVRDRPTGTERVRRGVDEIAGIAATVADRYPATFHMLGQSRYRLDGDDGRSASGEVYCQARHHDGALGADAVDRVMHIRYRDRYRRDDHGWLIADRTVEVLWTSAAPVPGTASRTGEGGSR